MIVDLAIIKLPVLKKRSVPICLHKSATQQKPNKDIELATQNSL
jgi:hypothetical protein